MSTTIQSQTPKLKPQAPKAIPMVKTATKVQPPCLSPEELRHIIAVIG